MSPRTNYRFLFLSGLLTVSYLTGCAAHRCGCQSDCCSPCNGIEISNVRCDQCENCPKARCGCSNHANSSGITHHTPMNEIMPEMTPATTPEVIPESAPEVTPEATSPETVSPKPIPETNPILPPPVDSKPSVKNKNYYLPQAESPAQGNIFSRMGKNISNFMGRNKAKKQHAYYNPQNRKQYSSNPYVKKEADLQDYPASNSDEAVLSYPELEIDHIASSNEINKKSWRPLEGFSSQTQISDTGTKKVLRERDIEAWPYPANIQNQPVMHTKKTPKGIRKISQEVYPNKPIVIIPATVD